MSTLEVSPADGDWFSLDQPGNTTGGDWRKVLSGNSTYKDNYAAGTAFIVIRRSDTKGLQLTKPGDHAMVAYVQMGMSGWVWTSPGVRALGPPLVNPVWIAINMLLRARGLRLGANATTAQLNLAETFFDVQAAIDAASGAAQAVATASYDASTSGLAPGDFVFLEFGLANEEHVNVISVDTMNQTFTAIVTRDHPAGSSVRPSIWPTAVLLEGNDLAFDIKAVASPNSGSDLTVVVQT